MIRTLILIVLFLSLAAAEKRAQGDQIPAIISPAIKSLADADEERAAAYWRFIMTLDTTPLPEVDVGKDPRRSDIAARDRTRLVNESLSRFADLKRRHAKDPSDKGTSEDAIRNTKQFIEALSYAGNDSIKSVYDMLLELRPAATKKK